MTIKVTAFLGSLLIAAGRDLRFAGDLLALRFAMVAGLYSNAEAGENLKK
jgi:hypothetical protein